MKGVRIWHFGIFTESGTVIDHGPGGTKEGSLEDFSGGGQIYVEKHRNPHVSPSEVVRRARSYIGRWNYSAIFKNCEHFINQCRNGSKYSHQVKEGVGITLAAFLLIVGIVTLIRRQNS